MGRAPAHALRRARPRAVACRRSAQPVNPSARSACCCRRWRASSSRRSATCCTSRSGTRVWRRKPRSAFAATRSLRRSAHLYLVDPSGEYAVTSRCPAGWHDAREGSNVQGTHPSRVLRQQAGRDGMNERGTERKESSCIANSCRRWVHLRGDPLSRARSTENTMICHCRTCRRVAAAPVVAWLTFPESDFQLLQGQPSEFRSSPLPVRRAFAARAERHSPMRTMIPPRRWTSRPAVSMTRKLFPPTHHSWLSHDLDWVEFGDGLPAFPEWRNDKAL